MTTTEPFYSRPIEKPATMLDGLCNFVQMIVNAIEAGDSREGLLKAVDLLDTLRGKSNPYLSVTKAPPADLRNGLRDLVREHGRHMVLNELAIVFNMDAEAERARKGGSKSRARRLDMTGLALGRQSARYNTWKDQMP